MPTRICFRFFFVYLLQFAFAANHQSMLLSIPAVGWRLHGLLAAFYVHVSQSIGARLFHLTGPAAVAHGTGFGDRALDWIGAGLMLAIAAVATAIWSAVARKRAYPDLWLWLRFLLRVTLLLAMFWYGSIKLWPTQIPSPSLAVLNEPVGQLSPMSLLWTLLGSNHVYEILCGCLETLCGLLLLYRRTALAGTLLAIVILVNVVLFDCFFDVPVRLYAFNLLVVAFVIAAPDFPALYNLFWTRRPAVLTSGWVPRHKTASVRYGVLGAEVFLFWIFLHGFFHHEQYTHESAAERAPLPVSGQWHLQASFLAKDPGVPVAFATPAGSPLTDIFLEPDGHTTERAADRVLYGGGTYDARTLTLESYLLQPASYRILQPDADHLVLQPTSGANPELHLTRVPLPARYPLQEGGSGWANEFGYER